MFSTTLITLLIISGNVLAFQLHNGPAVLLSRQRSHVCSQPLNRLYASRVAPVAVPSKKLSELLSVQNINQSLRAAGGQLRLSANLFLQSSMEKKIVTLAYPLTIVLLYLLFTSTFVSVQSKKMMISLGDFAKSIDVSIRKTGKNVSALARSFAKAKAEDSSVAIMNTIDESESKEAAAAAKQASDNYIMQAKKDIELKLQFIIQEEEKVKLIKRQEEEALQLTVAASSSVVEEVVVLKSVEESVLVAQVQEISLPLIAEIKSQIIPLKDSIVVVASSAIAKPIKALNSADATVAMLFILAVGSPLLQVLHQYITSA